MQLAHFLSICGRACLRRVLTCVLLMLAMLQVGALAAKVQSVPAPGTEWQRLDAEVAALHEGGKPDLALAVATKALQLAEKTRGPMHPDVATSLDRLGLIQSDLGQDTEAEPLMRRALAIRERTFGRDDPLVANSLNHLGRILQMLGKFDVAEPLYHRALAIDEKAYGPEHPDVATNLNDLGLLYQSTSEYAKAEPLFQRALAMREKLLGPEHADFAESLSNLATWYDDQGQYTRAAPLNLRALSIWEKALGPEHPLVALSINNLALLYARQGQYARAEPLLQRTLLIDEGSSGPLSPKVATGLNNLAFVYLKQAQYAKAEPLYQRALLIFEKSFGPEHPSVAVNLNNLGLLYERRGEYAKAEPYYPRALAIQQKVLGPDHPDLATTLGNLAQLYDDQEQFAKAESPFRRALAIREKALGSMHPDVAANLHNLAVAYSHMGRDAEALPLYQRALSLTEQTFGPADPRAATMLGRLALLHSRAGRHPEALAASRRATSILRARFVKNAPEDRGGGLLTEQRSVRETFVTHLDVLGQSDSQREDREAIAAEGFEVSQLARASSVGQSVAQMAARFAERGDALAGLVRAQQDTSDQLTRANKQLLGALSQAQEQRDAAAESELRKTIAALGRQLDEQNAGIEIRFPEYRALVSQAPVSSQAIQALLRPDEAMLVYTVADEQSFAWVVRPDRVSFSPLAIGRAELDQQVSFLRRKLQLDVAGTLAPMTPATSSRLYQAVFAPLETSLLGVKRILVVSEGALQSLPFGVLGAGGAGSAKPEWLARRYAFAVLPSVSALRALRTFGRGEPGSKPFAGFGDPVLDGEPGRQRSLGLAQVFTTRSIAASAQSSTAILADVDELRRAPPLPESALELKALSATLHGSPESLFLQAQATETRVKQEDLGDFRFLAFATHGVMAGELSGPAEPGLVLTPPGVATALDDGYLSASEVAQLKLNADWVLLSACNTASPDGTPGAEGLSGLAKAFFYAGSRSLLVSNWPVASEATQVLITSTMKNYARAPARGKPEALRSAMLAMMDRAKYSHPLFWAPFSVVGE